MMIRLIISLKPLDILNKWEMYDMKKLRNMFCSKEIEDYEESFCKFEYFKE